MTPERRLAAGAPEPLGLTLDTLGANIAVFSEHAEAVLLCLFDHDGRETDRLELPSRTGSVHHGHVAGLRAGQRYGLRTRGLYAPETGHRFNEAKLLLDPYATILSAPVSWDPVLADPDPLILSRPDDRDSASVMAKCVASHPLPRVDPAERPATPWDRTVIYEAHVKGLTRLWPGLLPEIAGTFDALADPNVIAHLRDLGITALELMPVQAFTTERHLAEKGLTNYWGYNPVSFLAPEPRYLGPGGITGLRTAVAALHDAGIEVLLDVVYNHTGEGDALGPTLSFRGLDNLSYYAHDPSLCGGYANETGCGNRLNVAHPFVLRLVMDSLRWWADRIGVDGFRFDLAPALTRGSHGSGAGSSFLSAALQDPVLRDLKLIAEPWDIGAGGYQLGRFPAPFAEWNDRFRDAARAVWLGRPGAPGDLADGLLGSARIFDRDGRRSWSSVNFVACHDGFTTRDLTMYETRHNEENGEDNRDGHSHNLSCNFGVEGPSDDPGIEAGRTRRQRSLLAVAMLAQGCPMLLAGDEVGNSQGGNNNAYCQDNEKTWIDWASADLELLDWCRRLLSVRAKHPVLRQSTFLHGAPVGRQGLPNASWSTPEGNELDWNEAHDAGFALLLTGSGGACSVFLALNPGDCPQVLEPPRLAAETWRLELDSAHPDSDTSTAVPEFIEPGSIVVLTSPPELGGHL